MISRIRPESALALLLLAALTSCGSPADDLPPVQAAAGDEYRLGPGDQIHVVTFGEQQLTGDFRIGDSGRVSIPLIDSIVAQGLSADQLATAIAARLKASELFKDPRISVEVAAYRPFFILGEVSKPGQYPYQPGMTVVTAAAVAGGFTYRAVSDEFSIVRTEKKDSVEGRAERQTRVQPGDVITVYERIF